MRSAAALAIAVWLLWRSRSRLVKRAALDGARLRATTVDGREHVLDVARIEVDSPGRLGRMGYGPTTLRHPDGVLEVMRPADNALIERVRRAGEGR